jgi:hypothetical protein
LHRVQFILDLKAWSWTAARPVDLHDLGQKVYNVSRRFVSVIQDTQEAEIRRIASLGKMKAGPYLKNTQYKKKELSTWLK